MRRKRLLFIEGILACCLARAAGACGGSVTASPPGDSGGAACGALPADSHIGRPLDGASSTFAINSFAFVDPNAPVAGSPWASVGLDIDGASAATRGHCRVPPDAQFLSQDGPCGIDNGFGAQVGQTLQSDGDIDTARATAGRWTLIIQIDGLSAPLENQTGLRGAVYEPAPWSSPPSFASDERWIPTAESFTGGSPLWSFRESYVVQRRFVSGGVFDLPLRLVTDPQHRDAVLAVTLHHASLSMSIEPTGDSAVGGILSGILSLSELHEALRQMRGSISTNLCDYTPPNGDGYAGDMMLDGTQDPAQTCTGLSIGIAFTARRVTLGSPAPPNPPVPPCPPK